MTSEIPDTDPRYRPLRSNDPRELGSFTLIGRLGSGGQGVVYLGRSGDGDLVAVKLLQAHGDLGAQRAIAKELAAAEKVAAFCTARVLTSGIEGDDCYIVTEYVEGPTLLQAIKDAGARSGDDLHRLAVGTATALAAIHRAGIVHRDLKPGNVVLSAEGPRVIDFGISKALDAGTGVTSDVVGTPAYMAPEQLSGTSLGPAADVFAWASLITFAATGRPPFGNDSIPAVINRILNEDPDLTGLPDLLKDLVAACLAKDPAERPSAHDALLRLLDPAEASRPEDGAAVPGLPDLDETTVLAEGANVAATMRLPEALLALAATAPSDGPAEPRTDTPAVKPHRRAYLVAGSCVAAVAVLAALAAVAADRASKVPMANATRPLSATQGMSAPQASVGSGFVPSASPSAQPSTPSEIADASLKAMARQRTATFAHEWQEPGAEQPTARGQFTFSGQGATNYSMSVSCTASDPGENVTLIGNTGYKYNSGAVFPFDASPDAVYSGAIGCAMAWARDVRWATSPYNIRTLLTSASDIVHTDSRDGIVFRGSVPTANLSSDNPSAPLFKKFGASRITRFTIELTADYLPRQVDLAFSVTFSSGSRVDANLTTTYSQWGLVPEVTPPS